MAFDDAVYTIQELSELIGAGVSGVKQVAFGTHTFTSNERANGATITTGITVNPAKTIVIINSSISGTRGVGDPSSGSVHYDAMQSILTAKTATTITVSANYVQYGSSVYINGTASWQLVEFY